MRLWTLHPKYLDKEGLVALWRESLLAKKVLEGNTKGYQHHPQLNRFKFVPNLINAYLWEIHHEAKRRDYNFDYTKIGVSSSIFKIPVSMGQLLFERCHLNKKLIEREHLTLITNDFEPSPIFYIKEDYIDNIEARSKI